MELSNVRVVLVNTRFPENVGMAVRACANMGGEFISISPASRNCINVMAIRKVDRSVDEMLDGPGVEKSLLAAKIQRLHIFFSLLIPDMSHEERQLLDDALIRTYGKLGITHENSSSISSVLKSLADESMP